MSPSNPLFAFGVFIVAFLTTQWIPRKYHPTFDSARNETIDGLRGLLALAVFIYHSHIWSNYVQTNRWESPDILFFRQLGHLGVSFFFMISSFLFVKMLLDFRGKHFDWLIFFKRRFLRLAPLHFVVMSIILALLMIESNWTLYTDLHTFFVQSAHWVGFGIFELNTINGYPVKYINAGVLWSLSYEWLLYFLIPVFSLFIFKPTKKTFLVALIGVGFVALTLAFRTYEKAYLFSFVGGAIAAFFVKFNHKPIPFHDFGWSVFVLFLFIFIFQSPQTTSLGYQIILTILFGLIAAGNNFFGVLQHRTLKFLGTISYGTYLIHGVLLFVFHKYIIGIEFVSEFSSVQYGFFIFGLTPIVIVFSFLSYVLIEKSFLSNKS